MVFLQTQRRCLVAGGSGFIGSNLCRNLLDSGYIVDCIDNLSTGRMESVADLMERPNFHFFERDVADGGVSDEFGVHPYSEIYHLACPTGVPNISRLGNLMLLASSVGTMNLLEVAKNSGAKFLFASTAEIYGDPEVFPQPESYNGNVDPVGPRSAYEEAKRFGEAMTSYFGRRLGIEAFIVRIFNTYGPGMSPSDQRVIPQMLKCLIRNEPVPIYGEGSHNRTFLHVRDLLAGFRTVMAEGKAGEVYNIGSSRQMTIRQLYEVALQVTGRFAPALYSPPFIEDHHGRLPDTSKLQALGWRQEITLEDGLRESFQVFCRELGAEEHASSDAKRLNIPRPQSASRTCGKEARV